MHVGKELPGKFPAAGPVRMRRRRGKGGGVEGGKWEGGKGEGGKGGEGINLQCLLPLRVHLCAAQAGGSVV